ncbi:MAG TPA: DUF3455 domain-containing protein [Coleofasciculaceae cyanobacterium]|jgi:hypothetical protein
MQKFSWINISVIASVISLGLCSVARGNLNDNPQVTKNLQVPTGQQLILKAEAQGAQIYTCNQDTNPGSQFEWTLKAPDAKLFNSQGEVLGTHYAGPTWEANDGSKITAGIKAEEIVSNDSIPWFLLQIESAQGNGRLASVKWIQRLHTTGGVMPKESCDRDRQNTEIAVPYTADYYFYRPTTQ